MNIIILIAGIMLLTVVLTLFLLFLGETYEPTETEPGQKIQEEKAPTRLRKDPRVIFTADPKPSPTPSPNDSGRSIKV